MKPLTTLQINKILKNNPSTKNFIGTFPACIIPKTNKKNYSFIINTHDHFNSGEHWVAFVVRNKKTYFFDSFGRNPFHYHFPKYFTTICKKFSTIHYNSKQIQGFDKVSCGYFCIHFIYFMSYNLNYSDFLKEYSKNFEKNDKIVYSIVKSL